MYCFESNCLHQILRLIFVMLSRFHLYFCFILVTDDDSDVENVLFYSSRILTLTTVLFIKFKYLTV